MYKDDNYFFSVSISKYAYETKEQIGAAIAGGEEGKRLRRDAGLAEKISFCKNLVTPDELLNYALDGYTFCALFSNFKPNTGTITYLKKDGYFTMSGKADKYFVGSYFVGVDIDESSYDNAEQLVQSLTYHRVADRGLCLRQCRGLQGQGQASTLPGIHLCQQGGLCL